LSRGRFITLEGIEGAGKTTVGALVRDLIGAHGVPVRLTREPGGTPFGERVRELVLTPGASVSPVAETLLMFAARAAHLDTVIRPALARGEWVVCDRFTDATRAYQGAGSGVDRRLIESLASGVHGDLAPDLTLLLDLPVSKGLERARSRASVTDRFESEAETFFQRVRDEYLDIARREPARVRIIDASQPLAHVEREVRAAVASLLAAAGTA
jgi:dTMP kinase